MGPPVALRASPLPQCLNHAHDEVVEISGMDAIHGVVTQKAGKRRKDRKRYD